MVQLPIAGARGNLVLARHDGQRVLLSGGITIELVRSKTGIAWLQVQAPSGVAIWREEIAPREFVDRHRSAA